jgi:hydroxypyruvate reductase
VSESVNSKLVSDVRSISEQWLMELELSTLLEGHLENRVELDGGVDVVALGKASREMADAAQSLLGTRTRRRLIVCDVDSARLEPDAPDVLIGEHPVPGEGSLAAARALLDFLAQPSHAQFTLFLLSGGASSLCALPAAPLQISDMQAVWDAALAHGIDITALNKLRAATSAIAGGTVLRHVRTPHSQTLIMVDNVVSGA